MDYTNITEIIGSGSEADVYKLDNYAVKLFKTHCPKQQAFYEAAIHSAVESTELPVPKIHEIVQIKNRWAIVMDLVSGVTMKEIIYKDFEHVVLYIRDLVDLHLKVHQIKADGIISLNDRLSSRILSTKRLNDNQKHRLINTLNGYGRDNKLCHGDFHFLNLIKSDKEIVIIDWIDATCGNPEADVCRTYLLYTLYAKEMAELYLDAYCSKAKKERTEVMKWLPIVAGARLDENKSNEVETLIKMVDGEWKSDRTKN